MSSRLFFFKLTFKPLIRWAASQAFVRKNRAPNEPEKGRLTRAEVNRLIDQSWQDFDEFVHDVSHEPKFGSRMNVRLAALSLAMLRSLTSAGIERKYAIELIGDACWKIYQYWGRVGRFIGHVLSRRDPMKDQTSQVTKDGSWPMSFPFNSPSYRARYVPTKGGLGFNVIRCPVAEYFHAHSASDLAVSAWCMLDYPLAEMVGLKLVRTQTLTAYESDQAVFQTNISSGIATAQQNPRDFSTKTPTGEFRIITKYPSKHMGNGSLFATPEDYELPGVPWTSFFHEAGYAFHGTYWHDNFGTPMSRGCVNMRIEEAKWLFRWVRPLHESDRIYIPGYGTRVVITP